MKKTLAASLFALSLFAACSGNAASSVPGTYELDKAKLKESMMAMIPAEQKAAMDKMPAEQKKQAEQGMEMALNAANVTLDLKADGTMTANTMSGPETGTWKLDGDKITFTSKKNGKDESHTGTYANGTITAEMEEEGKKMQMTFHKKK